MAKDAKKAKAVAQPVPKVQPEEKMSTARTVAWWALLVAVVLTWLSAIDYARVTPRMLRGALSIALVLGVFGLLRLLQQGLAGLQ